LTLNTVNLSEEMNSVKLNQIFMTMHYTYITGGAQTRNGCQDYK